MQENLSYGDTCKSISPIATITDQYVFMFSSKDMGQEENWVCWSLEKTLFAFWTKFTNVTVAAVEASRKYLINSSRDFSKSSLKCSQLY